MSPLLRLAYKVWYFTPCFLHQRDRQAGKTALASLAVQAAGYAARLAVIPLSLSLLGNERYGLFLAVSSLIAWGGLADLGFAPGLVNVVASASGREDREAVRRYISTAFALYAAVAAMLAATVLLVSRWPGLASLLGARTPSLAADARLLVVVCGLFFAAATLTRVVPTSCIALQEGYYGAWPQISGSLLSLLLLGALYWSRHRSLLTYAIVMGLPPLLAQVGLALFYFGRRHPDLRPGLSHADKASLRTLWGVAWPLSLHQVANLAVLYSANVLISNRLGPGAVPHYSVPYAIYAMVISVVWYLVSPYMPAYAEAAAKGDYAWMRRRAITALWFTAGVTTVGAAFLVILGRPGIRWWTGGRLEPGTGLLLALACFSIARACSNTNSVFLIGMGRVRFMALVYVGSALLFVLGSWWLLPKLGVVAVPIAGIIAHSTENGLGIPYAMRILRSRRRSFPVAAASQPQVEVETT